MASCWIVRFRVFLVLIVGGTGLANVSRAAETIDFNRDILPLLSDRCFHCHGLDTQEGDLRLDEAGVAVELGLIEPGDPDESELIRRIMSDDPEERMPPAGSGLVLSDEEKAKLRQWVADGAKYERHWSFVPLPKSVVVPEVKNTDWPRSDLDRFVLARIEAEGLNPAPDSERTRWLRRVTFDLTGLPPTLKEIDDFLADQSSEAYEKVVDRLLAAPQFGERLVVPWLDAARYADSYGYQSDQLSPTWPWRDWAVRALNKNLPYDQFLIHQLAGDMLPGATREQRLATAFNRLHRMTNEGGSISEEFRTEAVADRVQTFGTAVMALTLECCRCHDHRYDPLTQKDFYQFYAFFNSIDEHGTYHDSGRVPTPSMLLPNPAQEKKWEELKQAVAQRQAELEKVLAAREANYQEWLSSVEPKPEVPGRTAHYPLDAIEPSNLLANLVDSKNAGSTSPANQLVAGKQGQALQLAGDEHASFGRICGGLQPHDKFSVSMWVKTPRDRRTGLIFHRSSGTDVGYHGAEYSLKDGHLFFGIIRFWPGNAIAVRTKQEIPADQWVHVTLTYDATFSATGMRFYVNGQDDTEIVRDHLYKYPGHRGTGLTFGQRFRDRVLKGFAFDELQAYSRALTPVEAAHVYDGHTLGDALKQRDRDRLQAYYFSNFDQEVAQSRELLRQARGALLNYQTGMREIMVMDEMAKPRPAHLLARGQYDALRNDESRVERRTPDSLLPMPDDMPRNRLGLAQWLTHPSHPLTARVAVNRFWQMFFGQGIVGTSDNFGLQGSRPTHPKLLDWLARDFVNSGWDVKRFCRQIALSATYRQTSAKAQASREQDPKNLLLARGPSHRLPAEMIRDTVLAASGLLSPELGGPPVRPYQPPGLWRESNSMSPVFRQSVGQALYRRSLYTVWKRTAPIPNMIAFDASRREVCSMQRQTTNSPLQALVLLNDIQFVEACRVLAERVLAEGGKDDPARVTFAFRLLTGRQPSSQELQLLGEIYTEQRAVYTETPERASELIAVGSKKPVETLEAGELAATTVLVQAIANLDATVWTR